MQLSDGEKLILIMLCELHEKLGIKGETDTALVKEAIYSGNLWGLDAGMSGLFHGHEAKPHVVSETIDILDMWRYIESSYANLSDADKARIKQEAYFGGNVRFYGFDGNNEAEYISVASFQIERLDHFQIFKDRELNAHMPTIDTHRRMFQVFAPMRSASQGRDLDADQIIALMEARLHPDSKARKASVGS